MRPFTDATNRFDAHSYPATAQDLIEEYGEMVLDLPNGSETVAEALAPMEATTFQDAESARLALYSSVSSKAIGRRFYSDRDPTVVGETGPDQVSF
ncbi:DUF5789 family protein [Halomarina oriensis]|uniref:DUF2795 domain-containing protein n=1 Tax=Halomarina oriensis TaxID=671145 RepID=A0A6B0GLP1_9EURY|nr:DUF2795 domain-containing protein [Halomarina oriensis]MWG34399.1 DUF2795 domain-containing protein [Halomarina oriensis]